MITDHEVSEAAHELKGFLTELLPVFEKHGIMTLMIATSNQEAAALLEDENCRAIEQSGKSFLIAEFESREEVSNE